MKQKLFILAAVCVMLTGCGSLVSLSYPGQYEGQGKRVTASMTHFNFLMLMPASGTEVLLNDLKEQCGGKQVVGIHAEASTRNVFIGLLESVSVSGYCPE